MSHVCKSLSFNVPLMSMNIFFFTFLSYFKITRHNKILSLLGVWIFIGNNLIVIHRPIQYGL